MTAPHDSALTYADNGWRVIPIPAGGKRPRLNAWQDAATTDTDLIDQWFTQWPTDGVGIATGQVSGIFVIDVDVNNGKQGAATLAALEATHGELPETYTVRTGSGGLHYYYAFDPTRPVRNSLLGVDIDIRGEGGQVLAPPTVHPTTGQPYTIENDAPVSPAPDWVYQILLEPAETPNRDAQPTQTGTDGNEPGPASEYNQRHTWEQLLTADGWTVHHNDNKGVTHWTRPGKDPRDGSSGTVGHNGNDAFTCFTSSVPGLTPDTTYSKFGYYAATRHHGDRSAAARQLLDDGYKPDLTTWINQTAPATVDPTTGEIIPAPWPNLIPLQETRGDLPTFPIHTLPKWMADQIQEVADNIQVPIDLPATIGLAVLSLACAGKIVVNFDDWENSPTNLYLVVAMPPGAGKSPVFKAMTRCIEKHELALAEHMQSVVNEAASKERTIKNRLRKAEEKGDTHEAALIVAELNSHQVPAMPRLIVDDVTIEALVRILGEQQGRLAILSSEGGLFEQLTGRYNNDSKANLDPYLQAWSGDTIRVDRIGRESIVAKDPLLTIGLTVQPAVLEALAERPELAGRGLTGRFMYSLPPDNVGQRDYRRKPRRPETGIRAAYEQQTIGLLQQMASYQTPGRLTLDDPASDLYAEWRQWLERNRRPGGIFRPLAEWAGKLDATIPRLTGLLHAAHGNPHHGLIGIETLQQALEIADYWIAHAFAVHDLWGTDLDIQAALVVTNWIQRQGCTTFTARDVYSAHRRRFPKAELVEKPLALLVERGWIRPVDPVEIRTGRRGRTITFEVNPAVLQNVQMRAMRAHDQTGENGSDNQKPANTPFWFNEVRAMRAMCLNTKLGTHTLPKQEQEPTHENTGGRAHGAHGAQPTTPPPVENHDTYQAIIPTPEPDLSDLI